MTINYGGPLASNNVLETHPTHRKLSVENETKKKPIAFLNKSEGKRVSQIRANRIYGLADMPIGTRESFLANLIVPHSDRIPDLTASDLKTAFKSMHGVVRKPLKIEHNGEPAILGFLPGQPTPFTITVRETIAALS